MAVYVNNFSIDINTDFSRTFDLFNSSNEPLNLSNYSAKSYLRKTPGSSSYVGFGVSFVDVPNGKIKLSMDSTVTSTLNPGIHVYDILLTDPAGKKSIVLEGIISVRQGIST